MDIMDAVVGGTIQGITITETECIIYVEQGGKMLVVACNKPTTIMQYASFNAYVQDVIEDSYTYYPA